MSVAGDRKHGEGRKGGRPRRQTEQEFRQEFSHVWSEYSYADEGHAIQLKWRGQYEVLAIAKRVTDEGDKQVCIATGTDMFAALHALNARMGRDEWKEDKPWKGSAG